MVSAKDDSGLPEDLPQADFIFITYAHRDHCKKETIRQLNGSKTRLFAPATCKKELGDAFTVVREGEAYSFARFCIRTVAAYNTARSAAVLEIGGVFEF